MRILKLSVLIFTALTLLSCKHKKEDKAFAAFNDGVALNLNAIDEQNKGNFEKAAALNKQSIDKFRETLKIDSTHSVARSALGHSLYIDKQYDEAIKWFEQANKVNGDAAVNYRELGLCRVSLGDIQAGKADIDKAFSIDTTRKIREITLEDLTGIANLAFEYGDGYIRQGETKKGADYKTFSIGVLMLAYAYDKSGKDIALAISDFADKTGDIP